MLVALGADLIDTDAISRSLTAVGGAALPAIAAQFGPAMLDASGALDRGRMRDLVFADAQAKRQLEAIVHPLIGEAVHAQALQATGRVVVFDVPLLAESKAWRDRVHRVLVVDCREATQAHRVSQRPGWSLEAAERVIAQQASRVQRRSVADAVIDNDSQSLAALRAKVESLWRRLTQV